ncbi:hypothetical protein A5732_07590 [Mycobacterium colombiense]|nr:hypothetical protein A5732_07590 [Mycobacterium colombiense]
MTSAGARFSNTVLANYGGQKSFHRIAGAGPVTRHVGVGHPLFAGLQLGERRSCNMASLFLDLTNFTARTFWDDPEEVTLLAHSVLCAFAQVVTELGGHVLGLRGDGLFAGFGPVANPEVSVAIASIAGATAIDAIQNDLNPKLKFRGIEPIQARGGADFGETFFVRSGSFEASEVNVIGFAPNFAAKCEKAAASWEFVVGERFASYIVDETLLETHPGSPKKYQRDYETKTYGFSKYRWAKSLKWVDSTIDELRGLPLEELVI